MRIASTALLALLTVTLLAGCASRHDLRNGESVLDGGYQVTKVSESIFYIYARTNASVAPSYRDAEEMWAQQASRSCKGARFSATKLSRRLDNSKLSGFIVAEMTGYAICEGAGLSDAQVRNAIEKYERE
jgi:hypothetical protein